MDIAMVFDGLAIGGVERVGASYARLLRELGHTVTVINLRPDQTEFEREFPDGCEHVRVSFPRRFAPEYYTKLVRGRYIARLAYPFVYAALSVGNAAYKPVCRTRRPALRKTYDLAIAFSGHYNDLTFAASGFVRAKNTLCWLHGALYQYILLSDGYLNLYRKIKNLVVLVDDAQEEVLTYNAYLRLSIHKLYNPTFVDKDGADDAFVTELRRTYGKFLLMVARFSYPHKDHYTVVNAFRALRDEYHDDLDLVFLGSGPEEARVKECVEALGGELASHVHFMGSRYDTQNFYKAAHLLVHASVAGEGLPTVMLEAMAFDLPIVAADSKVGPREILGDDEYGLLCRVRDPEDMAEKIHRLCHDEALYDTYRERSRARLEDFSPETIKRRLSQLLSELADDETVR